MHPCTLKGGAQDRLRDSLQQNHGGPSKAHKVIVAEEGMKIEKVSIPPEDAQFLETREFQVVEVARWLNLPPHKLKHKMGERPGANLTEAELDYLSSCLDTHLVGIEQELDRKLIAPTKRGVEYIEHERNAHMRMLPEKKAESYKAYLEMGVIDAEYIAKKENLPKPKPKEKPAAPPVAAAPPADAPPPQDDERMRAALRALVADAAARFCRREAERVRRAAKKGASGLGDEALYADEAMVLRGYLAPAVRLVLAHAAVNEAAEAVAARLADAYVTRSKEELQALPARNVEDAAGLLVARWETGRPLELAESLLAAYRSGAAPQRASGLQQVGEELRLTIRSEQREQAPIVIPAPQVTVNVPAPNISVQPPDVIVNVPPQRELAIPAPVVNVPAPVVTVNVPGPLPMKVERDGSGKISGFKPTGAK